MSKEDCEAWKAKHIKGVDERVEIRKTVSDIEKRRYSQMVIVLRKNGHLSISGNGTISMQPEIAEEFLVALSEAKELLSEKHSTLGFIN